MNVFRLTPFFIRLYCNPSKRVASNSPCNIHVRQIIARYCKSTRLAVESQAEAPLQSGVSEDVAIGELSKWGRCAHRKSLETRRQGLQNMWAQLSQLKDEISINVFNTYIQICTENEQSIDYQQFLETISRAQPTQQTFLLLLKHASQMGAVDEAVDILMRLKALDLPIDENVFNALIIGYTMHKGLEGADYVLGTMKSAGIPVSNRTNWAIMNGLVRHGERSEFRQFLKIIPKLNHTDKEYAELLYVAGVQSKHVWLEDMLHDFDWKSKDHAFTNSIVDVCMDLVRCGCSDAAVSYYIAFVDQVANKPYGKHLLREMLNSYVPFEKVILAAKLMQTKNPQALFDLAHITLQRSLVAETYKVFAVLPYIRSHFFWPVFRVEARVRGEFGVFQVLQKMNELNVKADYTTLDEYVLKYYNLGEPRVVMESLCKVPNLLQRDVLPPIVARLLKDRRIVDAKILCQSSPKIPIVGADMLQHLIDCWTSTQSAHVVPILAKICQTNAACTDWTGMFLMKCFPTCATASTCSKLLELLKAIDREGLKITSSMYEGLMQHVNALEALRSNKGDFEEHLERLLDMTKADNTRFVHPKDMNIEELENHLLQLEHKKMETRGVLRKLIMAHARIANHQRVVELREIMKRANYDESAGMKCALFHSFALGGDLRHAKITYEEIKNSYSAFKIDTFKLIDYAALLVRNGAVDEAMSILNREAGYSKADTTMERNCWLLLGSAQKPDDTFRLFQLLVEKNFCKPTNVILGPILRPFVNVAMVDKLVVNFCNCCEKYKSTPLQLEVLCIVLEVKNEALLQRVITAISKVHGPSGARFGLICALAEKGMENQILKLLSERAPIKENDLQKRIDRWVNEGKVKPIQTLEAANRRMSIGVFDNTITSSAVMKIFCNRNDFAAALAYWHQLEDNDGKLSKDCLRQLKQLLESHNFNVPDGLRNALK